MHDSLLNITPVLLFLSPRRISDFLSGNVSYCLESPELKSFFSLQSEPVPKPKTLGFSSNRQKDPIYNFDPINVLNPNRSI
ncbi:hypothetical protein CH352_01915 [Leptospira hartskeerlii]|uniref:Uncharacterized protein n=1 Tax=Leptospira hartskeerlii TaxID=2023177 RepID=A0A2M9XDK0_9LEPT|nr:hypothetical protein CH357_09060 [Leptospira hartskeerlii]PJZ35401.1 hypothetical protein CH352_01915 [Leptospira hartskeerlii]